jgi:B12-binding domain/radical SAM domain protein of rhizo-twelve system
VRFSLINPPWDFDRSIYFGCREPHLPLEYGYSRALLEAAGHDVQILDGQLNQLTLFQIRSQVQDFETDFAVVTTAPSYLFWRCAPPELRVPQQTMDALRDLPCKLVGVGPHASTTPRAALSKLGADVVVIGECEEILPQLSRDWSTVPSICYRSPEGVQVQGVPHAANMNELAALHWDVDTIAHHGHHHHRFDAEPLGPGAEMETSRGCPYHCTFCAKDNFRDSFRRRPLPIVAEELDGLVEAGIEYVYFIDEIFLPYAAVLELVAMRPVKFGIQTRIDLWNHKMIDLLGEAGCVSIEAGVESITEAGRDLLAKKCKLSTSEITERLLHAKERVPFVQANLLDSQCDDPEEVENWRESLQQHGVWANKPVPLFPYPGSPDYTQRWGQVDDFAWERAHEAYLNQFDEFSDIQEQRPARLVQLEVQR